MGYKDLRLVISMVDKGHKTAISCACSEFLPRERYACLRLMGLLCDSRLPHDGQLDRNFPISKHSSRTSPVHSHLFLSLLSRSSCRKCFPFRYSPASHSRYLCTINEIAHRVANVVPTVEGYGLSQAAPKSNPNTLVIPAQSFKP